MRPGKPPAPIAERFWKLVNKTDTCWLYTGNTWKGYGQFGVQQSPGVWKQKKAHRIAYELLVGPIPEGLHLDHLCRVHSCVNPAHLEPVTNRENGVRGVGLTARALATHCHLGHEYTDENTAVTITAEGLRHRECRTCANDRRIERVIRETGVTEFQCHCGRYFTTGKGRSVHITKHCGGKGPTETGPKKAVRWGLTPAGEVEVAA